MSSRGHGAAASRDRNKGVPWGERSRPASIKETIGRHQLNYPPGWQEEERRREPGWARLYRTPYTLLVGQRLRRLRDSRGLTQCQARHRVKRPGGEPYSQSLLSRLEAGYANAPLYTYTHFAEAYEVDPAKLLGPDEYEREVGEAEMTLIGLLRRLQIAPDEAIARLVSVPGD